MRPLGHILSTIPLSIGISVLYSNFTLGAISLIIGVFTDIDHILEYFFVKREFKVRKFYNECINGLIGHKRIILVFHSYELLLVLLILFFIFPSVLLLSVISSFLLHLLLDQHFNNVGNLTYFFTYRLLNGFHRHCFFESKNFS